MVQVVEYAPELLNTRRSVRAIDNSAPLKYAANGKYLFQHEAHIVRVMNTKNGQLLHECIRSEQPQESKSTSRCEVTAIALHPLNSLQLLAAYEDGKVLVWDFIEEKVLQEFDVKAPILWMDASACAPSTLFLVVSSATVDESTDAKWSLVEFNMKRKRRGRTLMVHTKTAFQTAAMASYHHEETTGNSTFNDPTVFQGDFIVLAAGARLFAVRVFKGTDAESTSRAFNTQKLQHLRDVTCVAVHPHHLEFSIGDSIGQMYRYHSASSVVPSTALTLSTSKMHWHAHAVQSLTYSSDGHFLVSGGEECVLVSWHLESGRRSYLPRRSATITAIATRQDSAGYAVALQDHMVFQYNPVTKEEEWQTLGLARSGSDAATTLPSRSMVFDPRTHAVPLNGVSSAGVLQFYNPYKDRVLQSVVLTERNQVTRTEDEEIPTILAQHVCFSASGQDLVTLHAAFSSSSGDDQSLRFWKRRENGSFYVHTAVDAPHGSVPVSCVAYSPSFYDEAVVTAAQDGEFKIWKPHGDGSAAWHCQSVVQFRQEPVTAVAFASDGSLVAVAYQHLLTLWDVNTNALRHVIASADGSAIQQIAFTGATSPYVVIKTHEQVQVWNLLNLELWWRYQVPKNSSMQANASKPEILVWMQLDQRYLVLVFDPERPMPVKMATLLIDKPLWTVAFHPTNGDLLLMDMDSNVWRLGPDQALDKDRRKDQDDAAESIALDALYKRSSRGAAAMKKKQSHQQQMANHDQATALFEAPAHVLPSMTALYRSFMDTMLPKPSQNVDATESEPLKKAKKNKKRKKSTQSTNADDTVELTVDDSVDQEKKKRMKQLVAKELANPAVQQQTYSKLLEAFRTKHKQN